MHQMDSAVCQGSADAECVEPVPDVSILMCTYNRASVMRDALESWLDVESDRWTVEFIVIDNASTDSTRAEVEDLSVTHPGVYRYVYEAESGLSNARNRGIEEAHGAIVAFVDDDVYFDPQWLNQLMEAFANNPDYHCVGGMTLPAFEIPRPEWLDESMVKFYGATSSGPQDRAMTYPEHPFGVNMAFRRSVFDTVGRFNPNLGRIGYSLLSNEESELFYRIAGADLKVYYAARAVLHHRIPAERLDPDWLISRSYWQGVSKVVFDTQVEHVSRAVHLKSLFDACRQFLSISKRSLGSGGYKTDREKLLAKLRRHQLRGIAKQSLLEAVRVSG